MVGSQAGFIGVEIGLTDNTNRIHSGLRPFWANVKHHHAVVSAIGDEETIVRVVVKDAAGMIEL